MTYTTDFEFTVERDGQQYDLTITAEGEVEEADESVGIMQGGVIGVTVKATDVDDQPFGLYDSETAEAERRAEEKLNEMYRNESLYGDL